MSSLLRNKLVDLLEQSPENRRATINLKAGFESINFKLCSAATKPNSPSIPSIASQVTLISELLDRAVPNQQERDNIKKQSMLNIDGAAYPLNKVVPASEKIAQSNGEAGLHTRILESFHTAFSGNTAESYRAINGLDKTWINTLKHTQNMEAIYLHIDNAHFANTVRQYTEKRGQFLMFDKNANTTEGSLGHGQRTVIMGNEATSPQGFIQSVRFMAGQRVTNILDANADKDLSQVKTNVEFEAGRRVLDSMPAYDTLKAQLNGRQWENNLISETGLNAIHKAKAQLNGLEGDREYMNAAIMLTKELGKESVKSEEVVEQYDMSP